MKTSDLLMKLSIVAAVFGSGAAVFCLLMLTAGSVPTSCWLVAALFSFASAMVIWVMAMAFRLLERIAEGLENHSIEIRVNTDRIVTAIKPLAQKASGRARMARESDLVRAQDEANHEEW